MIIITIALIKQKKDGENIELDYSQVYQACFGEERGVTTSTKPVFH